jgi:hypothetical protein
MEHDFRSGKRFVGSEEHRREVEVTFIDTLKEELAASSVSVM